MTEPGRRECMTNNAPRKGTRVIGCRSPRSAQNTSQTFSAARKNSPKSDVFGLSSASLLEFPLQLRPEKTWLSVPLVRAVSVA
jgi:hypothetical protein